MNDYAQKETKQKNGGFTMFKKIRKQLKNEKGLTLVELLAVIVILGIIAAIAVPAIGNIIENSRAKALVSDTVNVMNAANMYFVDEAEETTVTIKALKDAKYLESEGKLTQATVKFESGGANTVTAEGENGSVKLDITSTQNMTLKKLTDSKISVEENTVVLTDPSDS